MFRCPSLGYLPASLVPLALEIAPCDPEDKDLAPGEEFQCELGMHHRDNHYGLIRGVPKSDREVWFGWSQIDELYFVAIYRPCDIPSEDWQRVCSLFRRHPGECDWSLIDPRALALAAEVDQALSYLRDTGSLPPWAGPDVL